MSAKLLYLRCNCHTPYHCLVIERDEDADGYLNVQFVAEKSGFFWHRVKYGLRHIFKGDTLIEADLILSRDEVIRLVEYASDVLPPAPSGSEQR